MFTYVVSNRRILLAAYWYVVDVVYIKLFYEGCHYLQFTSEWMECCYVLRTLSATLGYFVFPFTHKSKISIWICCSELVVY